MSSRSTLNDQTAVQCKQTEETRAKKKINQEKYYWKEKYIQQEKHI